jgi:GNAT superfamily N-acetyltransferase
VKIRDVETADVTAVVRLLAQLGYPADSAAVARRLERLAASDSDRLFVAEVNGDVVGLAGLHVSPSIEYDAPAAKVSAIVVDEDHRRLGIGEALLAAVEREARERACALVFLTTAHRRHDAHEFYRRLGFEQTGFRFAKSLE